MPVSLPSTIAHVFFSAAMLSSLIDQPSQTGSKLVIDLVPTQFFLELAQVGMLVNQQKLKARYLREIFEMFDAERLAEASVVCASRQNPGSSGIRQVRFGQPDRAGDWQARQRLIR